MSAGSRKERRATSRPVFLRALDPADAERVHRWHNDADLYDSLLGTFRLVSRSTVEAWIAEKSRTVMGEVNLAICRSEDSAHVGNVYLREIDWPNRRAELHVFIGDGENRGRGLGEAATWAMLGHAFGDLGLERVQLQVLKRNAGAIRMYERCGFQVEGTLREHVVKGGARQDVVAMAVLRGEYEQAALRQRSSRIRGCHAI